MIGLKFLKVGMRGFMPVMANDDRPVPPPIPIVRDETDMVRALQAEYAAVERQGTTCCLAIVKPAAAEGVAAASVLAAVGNRFSRSLRPYDGLFVFGANRYLIALPHIKPEDTVTVMDRLRARISGKLLQVEGGDVTRVTVSIGATMIDSAVPLQDNIARADRALSEAWLGGGDRVCLWSSDLGMT